MIHALTLLVVPTVVTAAFHTLIPDHWLPFVLVARGRGWSVRETAAVTAGSALLHVSFSIALGIGALLIGEGARQATGIGESIERLSAFLLTAFGAAYAIWFLARGGHQHSFGMHPHHAPDHPHPAGAIHPHDGRGGRPRGGWSLAAIVGLNPCALVIPYLYLAGEAGTAALLVTAGAFALSTVTCMVGVVILGLRGTARLESPFLMRYGEAVSGGLIAATGLAAIFFGG